MAGNKDGTAAIGRAICKGRILLLMKGEDKGKVVVMDVNSGDYEIDYDDAAALFNLLERRPDAFTWSGRVGYRAVHRVASIMKIQQQHERLDYAQENQCPRSL